MPAPRRIPQIARLPTADPSVSRIQEQIASALNPALARLYAAESWASSVASVGALRDVRAGDRAEYQARFVESSGALWYFNPSSAAADNGTSVLRPADLSAAFPGRWVVCLAGGSGTSTYGEAPAATGTPGEYTLAATPTAGTLRLYWNGQRLSVTNDYTLSGATITTLAPITSGSLLADYDH